MAETDYLSVAQPARVSLSQIQLCHTLEQEFLHKAWYLAMKGSRGREEDAEGAGKTEDCRWEIGGTKGREMKKDDSLKMEKKKVSKEEKDKIGRLKYWEKEWQIRSNILGPGHVVHWLEPRPDAPRLWV